MKRPPPVYRNFSKVLQENRPKNKIPENLEASPTKTFFMNYATSATFSIVLFGRLQIFSLELQRFSPVLFSELLLHIHVAAIKKKRGKQKWKRYGSETLKL